MLKLSSELNSFDKAADFGVDTYKNLRKQVTSELGKGSGLEVHHLIEKRFASKLGLKEDDMPSIVLTKEEHKKFTAAWREEIAYSNSKNGTTTTTATKEDILNAAKKIYKDYTEIFKTIESRLK